MGAWLHRWVYVDFFVPVWPNIAAALVMSTWIIRRVRTHLKNHHISIEEKIKHAIQVSKTETIPVRETSENSETMG